MGFMLNFTILQNQKEKKTKSKSFLKTLGKKREQRALKPPFWLLSLPLFLVLYCNTGSQPRGEDKKDGCEGDLNLEDKIGDRDGILNLEDKRGDSDGNAKDKRGDGDGGLEDRRVDDEDKRVNF